MIDTKIFEFGATSITVEVAKWKSDGSTPATYRCRIGTYGGGPDEIIAERESAISAERECTAAFIEHFKGRKRKPHPATINIRDKLPAEAGDSTGPSAVKPARKRQDDYEY